ncbi:hypothetical protein thalar_00009 [Litoreibacter arenae DSM 19593]|uniref:Uncharacterized protein n=1 Tax=Litoreibacter arenae DSM 19593 TaxID=1123360 RepID=S9QQB6_9RHOB|nr:hypothetical protein thalar_00009 [Litoreibacter arenae DSM 19593]
MLAGYFASVAALGRAFRDVIKISAVGSTVPFSAFVWACWSATTAICASHIEAKESAASLSLSTIPELANIVVVCLRVRDMDLAIFLLRTRSPF